MAIQTYKEFIKAEYKKQPRYYRDLCRTFERFEQNYIDCYGFSDWLESLRDAKPSTQFVISIAKTYHKHANRTAAEMPCVLSSIQRQYNIELPVIYGILSADYWSAKL